MFSVAQDSKIKVSSMFALLLFFFSASRVKRRFASSEIEKDVAVFLVAVFLFFSITVVCLYAINTLTLR